MPYMFNSKNEKIEIRKATKGKFKDNYILVFYSDVVVPHLLDTSTVDFLLKELEKVKKNKQKFYCEQFLRNKNE